MQFFNRDVFVTSIAVCVLSACGGGGSSTSADNPIVETPSNSAPITQVDFAETVNGETISIDVLSNDSDLDNDALSVLSVETTGTVGTVTIDGNTINYTPPGSFSLGEDVFTYVVSDGTDSSESTVTITNFQRLTLQGIAAEPQLNDAAISLTIGTETFTSVTDVQGAFELVIEASKESEISVFASGSNEQDHIGLVSYLPRFTELVALSGEDRLLSYADVDALKVTHLSSARWLLYQESLNEQPDLLFSQFISDSTFSDVLNLAGFIKVIADNDEFDLDAPVNTLSLFEDSTLSTEETVLAYLNSQGALNDSGTPNDTYLDALSAAVNETLQNGTLAVNVEQEDFADKVFAVYSKVGDYMGLAGSAYQFNGDNTGDLTWGNYSSFGFIQQAFSYTWNVENNKLNIDFDDRNQTERLLLCGDEFVRQTFGQDIYNQSIEQCQFIGSSQILIYEEVTSEEWLVFNDISNKVNVVKKTTNTLVLDSVLFDDTNELFELPQEEVETFLVGDTSRSLLDENFDAINSGWTFILPSTVDFSVPLVEGVIESFSGLMFDNVAFDDGGTFTSTVGNLSGNWEMDDGDLVLTLTDFSVSVRPFANVGKSFASLVTITEGDSSYSLMSELTPSEPIDFTSLGFGVDLPTAWTSYLGLDDDPLFDGENRPLNSYFGFMLSEAGNYSRIVTSSNNNNEVIFGLRDRSSQTNWTQEPDRIVLTTASGGITSRQRTWYPLNISESGNIKVLEYIYWAFDSAGDGSYSSRSALTVPRIQTLKREDLQALYPEAWEATVEQGQIPIN